MQVAVSSRASSAGRCDVPAGGPSPQGESDPCFAADRIRSVRLRSGGIAVGSYAARRVRGERVTLKLDAFAREAGEQLVVDRPPAISSCHGILEHEVARRCGGLTMY